MRRDIMHYFDNAATTKVRDEALNAMLPFLKDGYGNPSSFHAMGREARTAVENARNEIAKTINAAPDEIIFTSGGTEANNLALKGIARRAKFRGKTHIITSAFEHHAVLHPLKTLEKDGFSLTVLPVSPDGFVDPAAVSEAIREDTALVSIMYANNEVGTVQPIAEIGKICREKGVIFHTDAVQAFGHCEIDVKAQNIDALSISGHKIYAPKGVGALYLKKGVNAAPLIEGGAQERFRRSGTESVPLIVAFGEAAKLAMAEMKEQNVKMLKKRDKLMDFILNEIPKTRLNGDRNRRLPGNVNISFDGIEGESILLWLDLNGVCASSGSACTSGSLDPSHVLLALGLPHETAHGSIRFSFGRFNTDEDVDFVIKTLPGIIKKLRKMSPVWEES